MAVSWMSLKIFLIFGVLCFFKVRSDVTNIALGALCCASSTYTRYGSFGCEKAVDGDTRTDYASAGEGVGLWVELQLKQLYLISAVRIMDKVYHQDKNKAIQLLFNNGSSQEVTLGDFGQGYHWNTFDMDPVVALSVKVTVLSIYTDVNNGFVEIELLGVPFHLPPVPLDNVCSTFPASATVMWSKIQTGSAASVERPTWETISDKKRCFVDCLQIPGCFAVALYPDSDQCLKISVDCVLNKLSPSLTVWKKSIQL